jgi:hypothetical protein
MFIALAMVGLAVAAPLLARGDDKEIARQIIAKLKMERAAGRLQGFDVDLKVEKGVVWLKGEAASADQEKLVLETARLTPGVVSVMKNTASAPLSPRRSRTACRKRPRTPRSLRTLRRRARRRGGIRRKSRFCSCSRDLRFRSP